MLTTDVDRVTAGLPKGYRARPFEERDREPLVRERNSWYGPMEESDAEEWRAWERIAPDPSRFRVVVEHESGDLAAVADVSAGGAFTHPDGAQNGGVSVGRAHRGKGVGGALLVAIVDEAKRRKAPRLLSSASAAHPDALAWAAKRGFREIGRRIESYVELAPFDPSAFRTTVAAVSASGIAMRTIGEILRSRDEAGRERFIRQLYDAEAPMWDDVPWATPTPHWAYERFREMAFESDRLLDDASVVAYDGETIAGFTMTGKRQAKDGYTWMTGTGRDYRGRGLATAMKVEALTRAQAVGMRALFTTNDEPNKVMRGINAKLGYQMLPAHVQLEKTLSA